MIETAIRASGLALMLGATLLGIAVVAISRQPVMTTPLSPTGCLLLLLAATLLLLAFPFMYLKQANAAGLLGLVGFALLQIGVLLLVFIASTPLLYPSFNQPPGENIVLFVLGISLTVGLLLTGIAMLQAGVFPRWAGILLLAAMAGFFFDFFVAEFLPPQAGQVGSALFGILLALALVWAGFSMLIAPTQAGT